MKKYGILAFICLSIIVTVGIHYILVAKEIESLPTFEITTNSGNEEEVKSLVVKADYEKNYIMDSLSINAEGSTFLSEERYLENVMHYDSEESKQLKKKYKSFMRGKSDLDGTLFEDDQYLAYVNVPYDYSIDIQNDVEVSILNKETNKSFSFKQSIPDSEDTWYMNILDVRIVGDELKVTSENGLIEKEQTDVFVYSFSIDEGKLTESEKIGSFDDINEEDKYSYVSYVESDPTNHEVILYWYTMKTNENDEHGTYDEEILNSQFLVHDLVSDKNETVHISEEGKDGGEPIYFDGKQFHVIEFNDSNIEISRYDKKGEKTDSYSIMEKGKDEELEVKGSQIDNIYEEGSNLAVKDGKLVVISAYADTTSPAIVLVVDLKTKELLFEGEIEQGVENTDYEDYLLYIHSLELIS